jgi:hypothetical protein
LFDDTERRNREDNMEPVQFETATDGGAVLSTVVRALTSLGYSVKPSRDGLGGRAEIGSAASRFLAGGYSRRMVVDYQLDRQPGRAWVDITPVTSGMSGGILGVSKAKKEMRNIHQTVGGALSQAGLLAG